MLVEDISGRELHSASVWTIKPGDEMAFTDAVAAGEGGTLGWGGELETAGVEGHITPASIISARA